MVKFDRVRFGTKSSLFLQNTTIKHHLYKYPEKRAVTELKENLYVDDFLSGSDSKEGAGQLIAQAKKKMADTGLPTVKL